MKKVFALILCTILLLSLSVVAFADAPKPVAAFGFDGDEGFVITGGELTNDSTRGQVLSLNGGGKGASNAKLATDVFSKTDWADGVTIAFWVKADNADPGISPLYSFDIVDHDAEGYIATTDSLELAINTDGNSGMAEYPRVWADPANVGPDAQPVLTAGKWQHVAVTLSSTGMTIFLDGEVYSQPPLGPSSANFKLFVNQIQYAYGLQLGGWNCMWWDDIGSFAGDYDDVYLFNKALSQDEVKSVMNASFTDMNAPAKAPVNTGLIIGIVAVVIVAAAVCVVLVSKKKKAAK